MDNLLTIALEAHHDANNHHRHYRITVGRDLLDDWTVRIVYGRTGKQGQERRFGGPDADAMRKIVREHLRRRLSAPRRIGCEYYIVGTQVADGLAATDWLPADLIGRFSAAT